jgi:hypothetical protein
MYITGQVQEAFVKRNTEFGFKVTWSLEGKPASCGEDRGSKPNTANYSIHPIFSNHIESISSVIF